MSIFALAALGVAILPNAWGAGSSENCNSSSSKNNKLCQSRTQQLLQSDEVHLRRKELMQKGAEMKLLMVEDSVTEENSVSESTEFIQGPCPWSHHHYRTHKGPLCEDGAFSWDCVGEHHGQREQCPRSHPLMCARKACGASGKDYCCEHDCNGWDGIRPTTNCPSPSVCNANVPLDLVFLVDSSGSIGETGFDQTRHYLKKVAAGLPLGSSNVSTHLSIVQFSDKNIPTVDLSISEGIAFNKVEAAVDAMGWHTGDTHTGKALDFVVDKVFPHRGVAQMLAIVTDGKSNGNTDVREAAARARNLGVVIIAIGIVDSDYDELLNVTGGNKANVLTVKRHLDLLPAVNETQKMVCAHCLVLTPGLRSLRPTPAPHPGPGPPPTPQPTGIMCDKFTCPEGYNQRANPESRPGEDRAACCYKVGVCAGQAVGSVCSLGDIGSSLIPNPSFEEHVGCPSSPGQLRYAKTWVQATGATSDYWIGAPTCRNEGWRRGTGGIGGMPQKAPDGDAFVGSILKGRTYFEYVGACLKSPLLSGVSYTLTMDMNAATSSSSYGGDTNGDTELLCVPRCSSLPAGGHGWMGNSFSVLAAASPGGGLQGGGEWKALTFSFTPTANCDAVMFGPAKTQTIQAGESGTYVMYDSLNLQSGSAGSCNADGECVPA